MSGLIIWSALCVALLAPGTATTAPTTRPTAQLSPDDVEVINLCLVDLREHADDPFKFAPDKPVIVHAIIGRAYVWRHELARLRGPDNEIIPVPEELVDAWNRRTAEAADTELEPSALNERGFVLRDLSAETAHHTRFQMKFQRAFNAAGYVMLWLPVYSADGGQALLHLTFGPTSHGASATFLLKKQEGRWVVTLRDIAYRL